MTKMTIEEARKFIADLATKDGEHQFAREVLAGAWDTRRDLQKALNEGPFEPRKLRGQR
jgi:hypothetical protein